MSVEVELAEIHWDRRPLLTQQSPVNAFNLRMPLFSLRVTFRFQRRGRVLPTPASPRRIRIGLVQNVVHETVHFEYGSRAIRHEWREPICDWGSEQHRPFYSGPVTVNLGRVGRTIVTATQTPVLDMWHGPQGLAVASAGSGPPATWSNRDFEVFIEDAPGTGLVHGRLGSDLMTLASHSMVFQTWLVAIEDNGGARHVIAHSMPWSVGAWMRAPGQRSPHLPSTSSLGHQADSSESYLALNAVLDGVLDPLPAQFQSAADTTHPIAFHPGAGADARIGPLAGDRPPVFSGRASQRGREWMSSQGLSVAVSPGSGPGAANQPSPSP